MKYGVVVYHDTNNIGDDIQSYAAAQLLPQVDYYIEREHLDVFRPNEEGPVNVIMNGWFRQLPANVIVINENKPI